MIFDSTDNFNPCFPEVPEPEEIYRALRFRYAEKKERVFFYSLHLKTKESRASKYDSVDSLVNATYKPRDDLDGIFLKLPFEWDCNPFGDRNWQLHLNSLRVLDRYYYNYEKKADVNYLLHPVRVVKDWASYHLDGRVIKNNHFFMCDDMTCGLRQLRVAYLIDKYMAGLISLSVDDLKLFSHLLYLHWSILSDRKNFKSTNHTISVLHAIMSLVVVVDMGEKIKKKWKALVHDCFDHLVSSQFDKSSIHVENSPEYHLFVLRLFRELVKSGWYDKENSTSISILEKAENMSSLMRLPDGRIIPFGDSNARPPIHTSTPQRVKDKSIDECRDECLAHPLYCLIKKISSADDWSFLGIKSGHAIETHRHRDDLSFIWSESGLDLVVDPGKYAYVKDKMRAYIKSQRAHNTVQIKYRGKKSVSKVNPGSVLDFKVSTEIPHLQSSAYGYKVGVSKNFNSFSNLLIERFFYFKPGEWIVVEDLISGSNQDIEFDIYVHFSPELRWWEGGENNLRILSKGTGKNENNRNLYTSILSNDDVRISKSFGGELEPEINGFVSRRYKSVEPSPYMKVSGVGNARVVMCFSLVNNSKISFLNESLVINVAKEEYFLT